MKYLILLLSISLLAFSAHAEEFIFTPPTQRTDDSPLPASEIAGYKVFLDGKFKKNLPSTPHSFWLKIPPLGGTVTMITKDTSGRESEYSVPAVLGPAPKPAVIQ